MSDHDDVLDLDTVRELREMLGAGLTPVLAQFGVQAEELQRGIEARLRDGDLAAVRTLAHKLKGSAGAVGARALAAEAAQLERASADGQLESARARLDALPGLIARTVQALSGT